MALYPDHPRGSLKARRLGAFIKGGLAFEVIRPGYDSQGRRRLQWTQIVHEGVPIYEAKLSTSLEATFARFDELWDQTIGDDESMLHQALASVKRERVAKFRDGATGVTPAPSASKDGRGDGLRQTS